MLSLSAILSLFSFILIQSYYTLSEASFSESKHDQLCQCQASIKELIVKLKVILGFFTPNFLYLKKVKHKARFHVISNTYMSLPGYGVSGSRLLKAALTHGDS